MNRLDSISDSTGTLVACTYLGAGQIVKETDAGATLSYLNTDGSNVTGLDRFGRVVDQVWKNTAGTLLDEYMYGYDREGNRTYRKNVVAGASQNLDEAYTYDNLNQLASTQRGYMDLSTTPPVFNDSGLAQSWELDALGNWKSATTNGTTQTRTADAANEIATIDGVATTTYDAAGNMTSDGTLHYSYDAWNRLVEVDNVNDSSLVATYRYDGKNERVTKTLANGAKTEYYYNQQWQVLEERTTPTSGPTSIDQYIWSARYIDSPVVRFHDANGNGNLTETGDTTLYYTADANNNVTALVNTSGVVVERYYYDAYGRTTVCYGSDTGSEWAQRTDSPYANEVRYAGYMFDLETGNDLARNRYYSVTLATWISRDPAAADINLYRYCGNNPLNATDPTGWVSIGTTCIVGLYASGQCVSSDGTIKDLYTVCIRCEESHCWIDAKDEHDGTEHTYGRWKQGYGGTTSSGVAIDIEKNQGRHWTNERCTETCGYTPTINSGYGLIGNNCSGIPGTHTNIDNLEKSLQIPGMSRLARLVIPGLPHHVTQRGNCRQQTFFCDEDYAAYLELMAEWCKAGRPSKLLEHP